MSVKKRRNFCSLPQPKLTLSASPRDELRAMFSTGCDVIFCWMIQIRKIDESLAPPDEKSALSKFAEKYVIDGKPGLTPLQYFAKIVTQLKEFLRNHRNIKVRMILICEMEQQIIEKVKGKSKINFSEDKAYFQSETHINLEKTDVKVILSRMLREIMIKLADYQMNGSGWYFKEVISFEIHTVDYKPILKAPAIFHFQIF